jgi:hypothetical protein
MKFIKCNLNYSFSVRTVLNEINLKMNLTTFSYFNPKNESSPYKKNSTFHFRFEYFYYFILLQNKSRYKLVICGFPIIENCDLPRK